MAEPAKKAPLRFKVDKDKAEADALKAIATCFSGDVEADHAGADAALCDLLEALGYHLVVAQWRTVRKWYA